MKKSSLIPVFIVIQTLFFWFLGANEVLHVITNKAKVLSDARAIMRRSHQAVVADALDTVVMDAEAQLRRSGWDYDTEERRRHAMNQEVVRKFVGPFLVVVLTLLLVCLTIALLGARRRNPFHRGHAVGFLLILFGYIGELLLFLLVIKSYTVAGDYELARIILGVREVR